MSHLKDIQDRIVFTDHAYDTYTGRRRDCDRTGITIEQIARVLKFGLLGYAGHRRYKKTYRGLNVIYKIDKRDPERPLFVIITYYENKRKHKYGKNYEKILTF